MELVVSVATWDAEVDDVLVITVRKKGWCSTDRCSLWQDESCFSVSLARASTSLELSL